jgi:hypothetical protein
MEIDRGRACNQSTIRKEEMRWICMRTVRRPRELKRDIMCFNGNIFKMTCEFPYNMEVPYVTIASFPLRSCSWSLGAGGW